METRQCNKQYSLRVNWQASIYFPMPHQSGAPFANVRSFPKEQWYQAGVFFLPFPFPLSFFRPCTFRKGYYFYSPQSSTVIKSKMVATTILRTQTRFRPPKIRLNCRLSMTWNAYYSNPIPGTKKSFEQWIVAIILFGFICLSKKHITRVLMTLNLAT